MKISVIMATFNGEEVIFSQLESLKKQSLQPDEVLIFDDASSDNTVAIISEFIKKNQLTSRWHLNCNKKNMGYCNNFRQAAMQAKGELLFFADQDDLWRPEKIELMAEIMQNNLQIEMLAGRFASFQGEEPVIKEIPAIEHTDYQIEQIPFSQKNMYLRSVGCTMGIRRSLIKEISPFWYDEWAQDEIVWKLSLCRGSGYFLDYPVIYRRFHEKNTSGKKMHTQETRMNYLRNLEKSFVYMENFAEAQGCTDKKLQLINKNQHMAIRRQLVVGKGDLRSALFLLIKGLSTYHKKRGWLVELYLGLQNRERNKNESFTDCRRKK
ncbi:glycosyltransferase [Enterococcus pallens]|nr:glycosyltransferase [Enterococcus pallens]EOU24642.1 hypothetical protein I588_00629 [Enterococcus pallens ATCC BAA-351]